MELDFCKGWTFHKIGYAAIPVDLPHDAMLLEEREGSCQNGVNTGYFPGGKYQYEKQFVLTDADIKKNISIHFEGVYQNCTISLNGRDVGRHRYGYSAFDVDLTEAALAGENRLIVSVDNSLEPNCRWYSGSGIFRPVQLLIREDPWIRDVEVKTLSIEPARINVQVTCSQKSQVRVAIYDGDKLVAEDQPGVIEVPDAKLWTAETPYLYECRVQTPTDEKRIEIGIRSLVWSAKQGLLVNGQRVLLRGGCIHHDHGVLGACEYYDAEERRIRILKENGFNAVRIAHNPASQITLSICDRLGMYVMDETFDGWYIPKTYHDYARWFAKDWKADVEAMVVSAKNHPSVIMYSIGNEVSETADMKGVEVGAMLTDYVHGLDDSRPVTAGINVLLNVYTHMGMGVYKEKGDYEAIPLEEKKGYKEKKTGSAFFNAMAQKLGALMFFMSKGKKGDKACRDIAEKLDILGLNYASSRYDADVIRYPDRMMVGSETMVADLAYNWARVKKYPQLIGDFVWSAWDYLGEACLGDWTYHSYEGLPLLAGQGMIDITGKPLAAMYYMQIVWGLRKEPFVCVRPLNHAKESPSAGAWQFTNAIDSWTWHGYEGSKAVVEVFADADYVQLECNGSLIGKKKVKNMRCKFSLKYQPGSIKARAMDAGGREIASTTLCSGKAQPRLTVIPEPMQELTYLPITFTDEDGILLPYIEQKVTVETDGPELLGLGSALCKTNESYLSSAFTSYRGRLLAVVRGHGIVTIASKDVETIKVEV